MEVHEASLTARALHSSVKAGNVVQVKLLLWAGAKVNARDSIERTALHWACESIDTINMTKVIDVLLKSGAEVNVQDKSGRTPLHEACLSELGTSLKHELVVDKLLMNGAKVGLMDRCGMTPLHDILQHYDETDVCDSGYFLVHSLLGNNTKLGYHLEDEDILFVINAQNSDGDTPLHFASMKNNLKTVCSLLRMGAKVKVKNAKGLTPLHWAGRACAADVVNVLVDHGEYVNAKDFRGNTPLHLACSPNYFKNCNTSTSRRDKTIDNLLSKGAKVNEMNKFMKTPYEELEECYSVMNTTVKERMEIEELFIKHYTLNAQSGLDIVWILGKDVFEEVRNNCCHEIEDMKSTLIVKGLTLYEVLLHTNQPYLLSTDDILHIDDFLCSPDLLKRFPLYGHLLKTVFLRPKLLTLAVKSCYTELRKPRVKKLPHSVVVRLLTLLSNEDLKVFVKSEKLD